MPIGKQHSDLAPKDPNTDHTLTKYLLQALLT